MENLKMHTPDLAEENYKKLASMFPNAVTETINENGEVVRAIDADVLRQENLYPVRSIHRPAESLSLDLRKAMVTRR